MVGGHVTVGIGRHGEYEIHLITAGTGRYTMPEVTC